MFVLLLYNSGKYGVKDIRYKHKGRLIARNSNKKCLLDVATNLNSDIPKIILKNINIVSNRSINIPIKRLKKNNKKRKNITPNSHCSKNNRNNKGNKANIEKNVINSRDKNYDEVTKFKKCLNNNLTDCNKLNKCDVIKNISDDKQKNTEVIDILNNISVHNSYNKMNNNNNEVNNTVTTNIINENAYNSDSNSNKYDNDINDHNILNSNDIRENSGNNYKNNEESDITLNYTLAHSSNNVVNNSNNKANNTVANNIAEENILNDENYSISNITNGDNIVNPGHLENNCNKCSVLNTDIEKNSDIDNEDNSNKKNDTFNDIIDMSDFCNRRSYFSHSTCICDTSSCSDKNANTNNTYSKNNINDRSSCDICALNGTYSINKTPGILDQTIDPIKNSINYNKKNNTNRNKHINENTSEKIFENTFTTMDDENKNGENTYIVTKFSDDIDCAQESNKNENTISNIIRNDKDIKDLNNTTQTYNNDNMHENCTNICDENNSDITNYTDIIRNDTYTINDIGANNEVSCEDIP
ncbi:uncharacterized protein LOC143903381 [Temnothorax americanus]|uniref:uncharacterized protein LOC143903381 n=1 Tax=Temnothorax americanus TaxID=1964332 RepID=UPI004067F0B1